MKRALPTASLALALDLETTDDVAALDLDELLGKGDVVLACAKDVLEVYGLSLDDALSSAQVELLEQDGDSARVEKRYDLFGSPQKATVDMVQVDGSWQPRG